MKIYLVIKYGGQYEDAWESVECAFKNKEDAENLIEEIEKEIHKEQAEAERCAACRWFEQEVLPICYKPDDDDDEYCANEKWTVDDLFGARIEEVELKM